MRKQLIMCMILIMTLSGCGATGGVEEIPDNNSDSTTAEVIEVTTLTEVEETKQAILRGDTIGNSESEEIKEVPDEEVALIVEALDRQEVSEITNEFKFRLGVELLNNLNNMRITGDYEPVINSLEKYYRWSYEEVTFISNNFSIEEGNVIFASSQKDQQYITEDTFYEDYKTIIKDSGKGLAIPESKNDLLKIIGQLITPDVVNAQYRTDSDIIEFIPNNATQENDYTTYINTMLDDDFKRLIEALTEKIKSEAFSNGLTRTGSMNDSILVSDYNRDKIEVKKYYNYFYDNAITEYNAKQGSLESPVGLQSFGYSLDEEDKNNKEN